MQYSRNDGASLLPGQLPHRIPGSRGRRESGSSKRIYLDRTAFYPTSGGQPFDTGQLGGVNVIEVIDEGDRIAHILRAAADEQAKWTGESISSRRFDHMQQHTGQHLLSAVLLEMFDAATVSFHLGAEAMHHRCCPRAGSRRSFAQAERRANQIVFENRPVTISFQHSSQDLGLRKPTEREGEVRIISIQDLDRSACGGTHVRATGEIGPILLRKLDRIRGNLRIEFLCGGRAVARARADFEALSEIARVFSAPLDDAPAMVEAQREKLQEADRTRRRLATELAQASGRALYAETPPGPDGIRGVLRRVESLSEESRAEAQSFTASGPAIFLAVGRKPAFDFAAPLLKDSGVHAGDLLKRALAEAGGRGGGNAALAQGSLPSKEALDQLVRTLASQLNFHILKPRTAFAYAIRGPKVLRWNAKVPPKRVRIHLRDGIHEDLCSRARSVAGCLLAGEALGADRHKLDVDPETRGWHPVAEDPTGTDATTQAGAAGKVCGRISRSGHRRLGLRATASHLHGGEPVGPRDRDRRWAAGKGSQRSRLRA